MNAGKVEDKYTAILDATMKLVCNNGFHGTSMSMVAKEAGVSAGIIYHYFDSKDDLMDELYIHTKQELTGELMAGYDSTISLKEQMRWVIKRIFTLYIHAPEKVGFIEQYAKSPYNRPEIQEKVTQYYQPIMQTLDHAKSEKIFKDLPHEVLLTFTFEIASSLIEKHAAGLIDLNDELIEKVADACWDAITL